MAKQPHLDFDNLINTFVRDLERKIDVPVEQPVDIITFIDKEADLGIELTLQQKTILKSFYNLSLTDQETSILEYWKLKDKCTWEPNSHHQILVLESGRRSGKCLSEETYIYTNAGLLKLKELIENPDLGWTDINDVQVNSLGQTQKVNALYNNGNEDTIVIKTEHGFCLEGTKEHKVKTHLLEWKSLGNLDIKDKIQIDLTPKIWSDNDVDLSHHSGVYSHSIGFATSQITLPTKIDSSWAYFLGTCVASQAYNKRSHLHIVQTDDHYLDFVTLWEKTLSFGFKITHASQNKFYLTCSCPQLLQYLKYLGFDTRIKRKQRETPWLIRKSPVKIIKSYLKGLCDSICNYFIAEKKIELTFVSRNLAKETQLLLLGMGVLTKYKEYHAGASREYFTLEISGSSIHTFCKEIGSDLKAVKSIAYTWAKKETDKECIFYDRITEISTSNAKCLDISVSNTHSYTASGMVTHNSTLAAAIAAYEFYILCKIPSPQEYYGIAKSTPISILVLATTASQGKKTIFKNIVGVIRNTQYFKNLEAQGKLFIGTEEIRYEEKLVYIYSGNSQSAAQVGGTMKALVMDEVARFKDIDGKSNAIELWSNLGISTTTFGKDARKIAISSAWYEGDAIEQLYNESKTDTSALGIKTKSWDLNPIHAARDNPIIVSEYNRDPVQAAIEFEGVRPAAVDAFFNPNEVKDAFRGKTILHATRYEEELERPIEIVQESSSTLYNLVKLRIDKLNASGINNVVIHLDPAISSDAYALAVGHNEFDETNRQVAIIDAIIAWEPTYNSQVSITDVQETILAIHKQVPVRKLTADHYNSAETIQRMRMHGIPSEVAYFTNRLQLSMYTLLRQLFHERRIIIPFDSAWSSLALSELCKVQLIKGQKVDHMPGYSKDLADAIAAVCWTLGDRLLADSAIDFNISTSSTTPAKTTNQYTQVRHQAVTQNSRHRVMSQLKGRSRWLDGLK